MTPKQVAEATLETLAKMQKELDQLANGDYFDLIDDTICDETEGDKDTRRREAMRKAVTLAIRINAGQKLASALKLLVEAAPGKKAQADEAAQSAGGDGTGWGDDLDVAVARAN